MRFWAYHEAVEPTRFHAVRSWKTIHIEPFDHALVRVDSLTEGGDPIAKLWKIYLGIGRDGDRLITRIVDAADESMPPPFLAKRQESPLSRKSRLEKEEAQKKLERLSRKIQELEVVTERKRHELEIETERKGHVQEVETKRKRHELEVETQRKLARLRDSLDKEKREMAGRMDRQLEWMVRMAEQLDRTKRELAAAKGEAGTIRSAEPRLVVAELRIPGLRIAVPDRVRPLGDPGPAPTADASDYDDSFQKAEDSYREGNYQDAAGIYSDLIARDPKVRAAYLRRGDCYASLRDFDKAIVDFGMAIRLMPRDPRSPREKLGLPRQRDDGTGPGRRCGGPPPRPDARRGPSDRG